MPANAIENRRIVWLLLPERGMFFPLDTRAFHFSQSTRAKIEEQVRSAYILEQSGRLYRFARIEIAGFVHESVIGRIFDFLTRYRRIEVSLQEIQDATLSQIKIFLIKSLPFRTYDDDDFDFSAKATIDELLCGVVEAQTIGDVMALFAPPPLEDALDVL